MLYLVEEGACLRKQHSRLVITKGTETIREVPIEKVDAVVIFSGTHLTSPCAEFLLEKGIPVTFLSARGKFFGRLESTRHVNIIRQRLQFMRAENDSFSLELAKRFIYGKIKNNQVLLRRYNRYALLPEVENTVGEMNGVLRSVESVKSREKLNGIEGYAGNLYFRALGKMSKNGYNFLKRTRQPPEDPFNSMLSFGYTLLMYELYTAIVNRGLHPYMGFLHRPRSGHPALASDLMEEWRPVIVDSLVLKIIHGNEIKVSDFNPPDAERGVYLTKDGSRLFIKKYMEKMEVKNKYLSKEGFGQSYRETLAIQVSLLVDAVESGNPEQYSPLLIR